MVKDLCFEIIDKCPNECKFCSSNSCYSKNTIIKFEDFKRVIDYFMSQGGIGELSFSGGEPFLHPDIFEMLAYAKGYGIRCVIFTSGIKVREPLTNIEIATLNKEKTERLRQVEMAEPWNEFLKDKINNYYDRLIKPSIFSCITKDEFNRLKELGLDKIVFDFQAYEHDTDEILMGRDRQKHTCLLDSLINASISGIETDVHFIPMKLNYKEIVDLLELLEIAGINNISLLKFVPQGRGRCNSSELMLTDDEMNEFMSLLDIAKSRFSGNVRIGIPLQGENTHLCNAGLEKLDIKFDGTILPCPAFKELDVETMKKYGIKDYSIYRNLEEVKTPGGKRLVPLCQRVYKN